MPQRSTQFTSESVSMGHPDKVADQVADAVLDAALAKDPEARVACEVLITGGTVVVSGEISSHLWQPAASDIAEIARETILSIGYDDPAAGFDARTARYEILIQPQSPDIAMGVDGAELGAGDQGLMFGYAVAGAEAAMPLPILLAHRLVARQAEVRSSAEIPGLRPDAKAQVTVRYTGREPVGIASVVLSTQHDPRWNEHQAELRSAVAEHILGPVLGDWWNQDIAVYVNPTGKFELGGPAGDTGLTGRKIIVDTYGGWARHGGGAFSGKDPSKVDRSGSYMARSIAKHVVAAGLAVECEVRLAYVIGMVEPSSVTVDCLGTAREGLDESAIERAVREVFPLSPSGIIGRLGLQAPVYRPTAVHGHFGRLPDSAGPGTFSWERLDHVDDLRAAAGG
jgi:S-adenosylmethionine synthetase